MKIQLFLVLIVFLSSFSVFAQNTFRGKASASELETLKANFDWNSQKYFIIVYRNSKSRCVKYNADEINTNDWVMNLVRNANVKNSLAVLLLHDKKSYANSSDIFVDKNMYVFKKFLNTNSCFSLIIFSQSGSYIGKNAEFTEADIHKFVNLLY